MNERLDKIFDCVAFEVFASGGDGCGTVVFKATLISEVAKAFEEWKATGMYLRWLPYRIDYSPNHVLFTDKSNENITFISKVEVDTWSSESRGIGHNEVWLEVW